MEQTLTVSMAAASWLEELLDSMKKLTNSVTGKQEEDPICSSNPPSIDKYEQIYNSTFQEELEEELKKTTSNKKSHRKLFSSDKQERKISTKCNRMKERKSLENAKVSNKQLFENQQVKVSTETQTSNTILNNPENSLDTRNRSSHDREEKITTFSGDQDQEEKITTFSGDQDQEDESDNDEMLFYNSVLEKFTKLCHVDKVFDYMVLTSTGPNTKLYKLFIAMNDFFDAVIENIKAKKWEISNEDILECHTQIYKFRSFCRGLVRLFDDNIMLKGFVRDVRKRNVRLLHLLRSLFIIPTVIKHSAFILGRGDVNEADDEIDVIQYWDIKKEYRRLKGKNGEEFRHVYSKYEINDCSILRQFRAVHFIIRRYEAALKQNEDRDNQFSERNFCVYMRSQITKLKPAFNSSLISTAAICKCKTILGNMSKTLQRIKELFGNEQPLTTGSGECFSLICYVRDFSDGTVRLQDRKCIKKDEIVQRPYKLTAEDITKLKHLEEISRNNSEAQSSLQETSRPESLQYFFSTITGLNTLRDTQHLKNHNEVLSKLEVLLDQLYLSGSASSEYLLEDDIDLAIKSVEEVMAIYIIRDSKRKSDDIEFELAEAHTSAVQNFVNVGDKILCFRYRFGVLPKMNNTLTRITQLEVEPSISDMTTRFEHERVLTPNILHMLNVDPCLAELGRLNEFHNLIRNSLATATKYIEKPIWVQKTVNENVERADKCWIELWNKLDSAETISDVIRWQGGDSKCTCMGFSRITPFDDFLILGCGHIFCIDCLETWVKNVNLDNKRSQFCAQCGKKSPAWATKCSFIIYKRKRGVELDDMLRKWIASEY